MGTPVYYAIGDKEILNADSIHAAVEEFAEEIHPDTLPDTVEVQGYARAEVADYCFEWMADNLIENLDENYGSPEEPSDYALSDKAKGLLAAFAEQVKSEYTPWQCRKEGDPIVVKTADYIEDA